MSDNKIPVEYYNQASETVEIKNKWWTQTKEELFKHAFGVVKSIETNQNYRFTQNIKYARLYSNMEILGFYGTLFSRTANNPVVNNRVTLNVIKACVDTAASKIAKNKPRPVFLTSGGDYSDKKELKILLNILMVLSMLLISMM